MSGFAKDIFSFNLTLMRIFGFYPPLSAVAITTLTSIHLLIEENVDIVQISDSSFLIIQVGCLIFKLLPFIHDGDGIRKNINKLENSLFAVYSEKQKRFMEDCKKNCQQVTWLFFGFCILSLILFTLIPLLGRSRNFPIEIWLPFEAKLQLLTYVTSYILITAGIGIDTLTNGVIDTLISGLACFAATQLRILRDNLQHLDQYCSQETSNEVPVKTENAIENECLKSNKMIYKKIIHCIKHHNAILDFIQNYETVYSSVVFTQFIASILVICLSCWQLSMVEPFTFKFFFMVCFLITMLFEIFLFCYFGTTLYEESNTITSSIYMSNWYDYDINSKKALIILMERSQKPVIVSAGKILDLSLTTFTTILRRAYSLFAVLKNY